MPIDYQNYTVMRECRSNPEKRVCLVEEKDTGKQMILKVIKIRDWENQSRDLEKHKQLNNECLTRIIDYQASCGKVMILMEYAGNGDLESLLPKVHEIPQRKLLKFCYRLLKGLEYLHSHGAVHGHLTPSNILLDSKFSPKIAQVRTRIQVDLLKQSKGKDYEYIAPEIHLNGKISNKVDVWSLGILFYELTNRSTPFQDMNVQEIQQAIEVDGIDFVDDLNPAIIGLIYRMLEFDPDNRPTVEELLLEPFFDSFAQKEYAKSRLNSQKASNEESDKLVISENQEQDKKEHQNSAQKPVIDDQPEIQINKNQNDDKGTGIKKPKIELFSAPIPISLPGLTKTSKIDVNNDKVLDSTDDKLDSSGSQLSQPTIDQKTSNNSAPDLANLLTHPKIISSALSVKNIFDAFREVEKQTPSKNSKFGKLNPTYIKTFVDQFTHNEKVVSSVNELKTIAKELPELKKEMMSQIAKGANGNIQNIQVKGQDVYLVNDSDQTKIDANSSKKEEDVVREQKESDQAQILNISGKQIDLNALQPILQQHSSANKILTALPIIQTMVGQYGEINKKKSVQNANSQPKEHSQTQNSLQELINDPKVIASLFQLKQVIEQKNGNNNATPNFDNKQSLNNESDKTSNKLKPSETKQDKPKIDIIALASNPHVLGALNNLKEMYDERQSKKKANETKDSHPSADKEIKNNVLLEQNPNVTAPKGSVKKNKVKDFFKTLVKSPSSLFKKKPKMASLKALEENKVSDQPQQPNEQSSQHQVLSLANLDDTARKVNQVIEENIVLKSAKDRLLAKVGFKKL